MKLTDKKFIASVADNNTRKYSTTELKTALGSSVDSLFDKIASEVFEPELGSASEPAKKEKQPKYPGMWSKAKIGRFFRKLRSGGMSSKEKAVQSALHDGAAGRGGEDDPRVHAFLEAMWDRSVSVTAFRELYAGLSADSLSSEEEEGTTVQAQAMPGMPPMGPPPGGPGGAPMGMPGPMGPPAAGAPPDDETGEEVNKDDVPSLKKKLEEIEELASNAQEQVEDSDPPSESGPIPAPSPKVISASIYRKIAAPGDKDDDSPTDLNAESPDDEPVEELAPAGVGFVGGDDYQIVPTTSPSPSIGETVDSKVEKKLRLPPVDLKNRIFNPSTGKFDKLHESPSEDSGVGHLDSLADVGGAQSAMFGTAETPEQATLTTPDQKNKTIIDAEIGVEEAKSALSGIGKKIVDNLDSNPGSVPGDTRADKLKHLVSELRKLESSGKVSVFEANSLEKLLAAELKLQNLYKQDSRLNPERRVNQPTGRPGKETDVSRYGRDPELAANDLTPSEKEYKGSDVRLKTDSGGKEIKPLENMSKQQLRDLFQDQLAGYKEKYYEMTGKVFEIERVKPHGPSWMRSPEKETSSEKADKKFRARDEVISKINKLSKEVDGLSEDTSSSAIARRDEVAKEIIKLRTHMDSMYATDLDLAQDRQNYAMHTSNVNLLKEEKELLSQELKDVENQERKDSILGAIGEIDAQLKTEMSELSKYSKNGRNGNEFLQEIVANAKVRRLQLEKQYDNLRLQLEELSPPSGENDSAYDLDTPEANAEVEKRSKEITAEMGKLRGLIYLQDDIIGPIDGSERRRELIEVAAVRARKAFRARSGLERSLLNVEREALKDSVELRRLKNLKIRMNSGVENPDKFIVGDQIVKENTPEFSELMLKAQSSGKTTKKYLEGLQSEIKALQESVSGNPTPELKSKLAELVGQYDKYVNAYNNPTRSKNLNINEQIEHFERRIKDHAEEFKRLKDTEKEYIKAIEITQQDKKTAAGEVSVLSNPRIEAEIHERPYYHRIAKQESARIVDYLYKGALTDEALKHGLYDDNKPGTSDGDMHRGAYEIAYQMAYNYFQSPHDQAQAVAIAKQQSITDKIEQLKERFEEEVGVSYKELDKLIKNDPGFIKKNPKAHKIRARISELGQERAEIARAARGSDKSKLVEALATHLTTGQGMRVPFKFNDGGSSGVVTADDIANNIAKYAEDTHVLVSSVMRFAEKRYSPVSTGQAKWKGTDYLENASTILLQDSSELTDEDVKRVEYQKKEQELNRLQNQIDRMSIDSTRYNKYDSFRSKLSGYGLNLDQYVSQLENKIRETKDDGAKSKLQLALSEAKQHRDRMPEYEAYEKAKHERDALVKDITKFRQETYGGDLELEDGKKVKFDLDRRDKSQEFKPARDRSNISEGAAALDAYTPQRQMFRDGTGRWRNVEIGNFAEPMLWHAMPVQDDYLITQGKIEKLEAERSKNPERAEAIDAELSELREQLSKSGYIINGHTIPGPSVTDFTNLMKSLRTRKVALRRDENGNVLKVPKYKEFSRPLIDPDTGLQAVNALGKEMYDKGALAEIETDENGNAVYEEMPEVVEYLDMSKVTPEVVAKLHMYQEYFENVFNAYREGMLLAINASKNSSSKAGPGGKRVVPEKENKSKKDDSKPAKAPVLEELKKTTEPKKGPNKAPLVNKFKKGSELTAEDKSAVDDDAKKYYTKMFPGQYGKQMGNTKSPKKDKAKKKSDRLADVVDSVEAVFLDYGLSDLNRIASISEFVADDTMSTKYASVSAMSDIDRAFGKSFYKLVANHIVKHSADRPFGGRIPSIVKDAIVSAALAESGLEEKVMNYVAQKMKTPKVRTKSQDSVDVESMDDKASKSKPVNRSYGIEFNVDDMYKKGYYVHMVISWDPDDQDAKKSIDGLKQAVRSYVKGLEGAKEFHNIGFLGQIEFKELDEEAGMAEVYFKTRIDGDAIQVYRDVPKSKNK